MPHPDKDALPATPAEEPVSEQADLTGRPVTIGLVYARNRGAEIQLSTRAQRMTRKGRPIELRSLEKSVQFLRMVSWRGMMALPALYTFYAATIEDSRCHIDGFAGLVTRSFLKFTSLNTIALVCRTAFDHEAKGASLTGKGFAKISDPILLEHADYWAKRSGLPVEDATRALRLLRRVFGDCSKTDTDLLAGASTLGKRIGLLKQYAHRHAAHSSQENFSVAIHDMGHVVAALTVISQIINTFDDSTLPKAYHDDLDEASATAAAALFPSVTVPRLFKHIKVETAGACWRFEVDGGQQLLHERLPYLTGWQ